MSLYSSPSIYYNDEMCSDESTFFTPEVSFVEITPQNKKQKNKYVTPDHIFNEQHYKISPSTSSFTSNVTLLRKNDKENGSEILKLNCDNDNYTSVSFNSTPKSHRNTPLRCISNLVTPLTLRSNIWKCNNVSNYEEENKSCCNNFLYKNDASDSKLIVDSLQSKKKQKSKLTFGQKLEICEEVELKKKSQKLPKIIKICERPNQIPFKETNSNKFSIKNYGTLYDNKSHDLEDENGDICDKNVDYSVYDEDSFNSSLSLIKNKKFQNVKKKLWHFFGICHKGTTTEKIRLTHTKKFFSRWFQKISVQSFKSLFSRNNKSFRDVTGTMCNQCLCSTVRKNEELMHKFMLKLNSLETELKEIKSIIKNTSCGSVNINNTAPPQPPPPPPPPLPNFLSSQSTGTLKRKADLTTPENEQIIKRPSRIDQLKNHFTITVEDIKSVKLRKTPVPCNKKKIPINANSPVKGMKDGVLHSVKFKPIRKATISKKDLSHIVSDILSPKKKNRFADGNIRNPNINDEKENNNCETTPVKFKQRSIIFQSAKRKDILSKSPIRKRQNSDYSHNINHDLISNSTE